MPGKEGLNFDEKIADSAGASFLRDVVEQAGFGTELWTNGELVLTQKGIVFLETEGFLGQSRSRRHSYE